MSTTAAMNVETDDGSLVEAACAGDRGAFGRLIERYFGTVWAISYARLRHRQSAEDLVQEVFLIAFLRLRTLSDPRRVAGWLGQIARHRAIDWVRHERRSSKLVAMVPVQELAGERMAAEGNPEQAMCQDEQDEAVREAIWKLPEGQREMVLLRFGEGLSATEIAERLGVHPGTVGRQLEKALSAMRGVLEATLQRSLSPLRSPGRAGVRALAVVGAAAMLPASAKAALLVETAGMPSIAGLSSGGAVKAALGMLGAGAGTMTVGKTVGLVAVAVLAGTMGVVTYSRLSGSNAPAAAPVQATAEKPVQSEQAQTVAPMYTAEEQAILAAKAECYPPEVCEYLLNEPAKISRIVDPDGSLHLMTQATAIDHEGMAWMAIIWRERNMGRLTLDMGNTSQRGPMGIVSDSGRLIPVDLDERNPAFPGALRVSARVAEPWLPGTQKSFCWIMRVGPLLATPESRYATRLLNDPGHRCVQQLILVTPAAWRLQSSSLPAVVTREVGAFTISLWQQRIESPQGHFEVDVELAMKEQEAGR